MSPLSLSIIALLGGALVLTAVTILIDVTRGSHQWTASHHALGRRRARSPISAAPILEHGEYLASERELFQVTSCGPRRAIVEDCRSGALFDVAIEELLELRRIRLQRDPSAESIQ